MVDGPGRYGDVALVFADGAPGRARGGTDWEVLERGPGWRLWTTAPTSTWRGYEATLTRAGGRFELVLGSRPDHWLAFAWDPEASTWTVTTDRFATVHAYAGDGVISTYSPATWQADPPLDWLALAGFVRLGWYPADRMPVEGVRVLRPASEHRWSADGESLGPRRWQGWAHDPDPAVDVDRAVDELGGTLTEVLDDEVAGRRTALPVSGGLDSRVTVAVLTRSGAPDHDLWPFSYGYDQGSPELRIARQVTAARGLPLHAHVIEPYLWAELDRVLAATEGLVDLTLCRQASVASELAAADAVVAAHWGDVWFGVPAAPAGGDAGAALLAASTKRGHEWLTEHVVRPHLGRDPEPELRALLAAEADAIDPGAVADPRVRLLALKTEQWSFRWTQATLRAHRMATSPRLPFYDPRLADLALRLPADLLAGRRLQIELLRRHAPDLAAVEWQEVETDLFGLRHERTWRLPHRVLRRLHRRLRPPTARLRNWEVQLLEAPGPEEVDRRLVEPGAAVHDLVERRAVAELVRRHRAQPRDPGLGYAVSALLTLAAWKEAYT